MFFKDLPPLENHYIIILENGTNNLWHRFPTFILFTYTSAFLYKCRSTLRTTYLNLSFSSRNTDFLLTTRTFINMINFSLFHQFFLFVEKTTKLICLCEILLIFCIAFCNIFRKNTEITINDCSPSKNIQHISSCLSSKESRQYHCYQSDSQ